MSKIRIIIMAIRFLSSHLVAEAFGKGDSYRSIAKSLHFAGVRPVAGIESVMIDGSYFYYGYSYSADEVMSPLFDNQFEMAKYAARNFRQTDGRHPRKYWINLARESENYSGAFGNIPVISRKDIHGLWTSLEQAVSHGQVVADVKINSFITNILIHLDREHICHGAWSSVSHVLDKNHIEQSSLCSDEAIDLLNRVFGLESSYSNISVSDAATMALAYLHTISSQAEDGWKELLSEASV